MKILIFTNVFFPSIGGLENLTLNLINEFIKDGHEVKVITEQNKNTTINNIAVYKSSDFLNSIKLFFWCDVFYMPNISLRGVWMLPFNPRKRWIISHNDFSLYKKTTLVSKIKLFLIKFAKHNISVSKSVANSLNTPSKIIYNCYDDAVFNLKPNLERIYDFAFVGRLVSQKGCDNLIEACSKLNKPFTLNIIGTGPEENYLRSLVDQYKLTNSVKFIGLLQNEQLAVMLNQHKTLVVPSINEEGFGIVALEGMACGCNIIASNAGGLAEAVDQFGSIYPMRDVEQLGILLDKALQNTPNLNSQNDDLQQYLNDHTKSVVAKRYFKLFSE